jgi:predicted acetyltransferase
MDTTQVMALYNQFERKIVNIANGYTEEAENLVKFVSNDQYGSFISFYELDDLSADAQIANQLDFYQSRSLNFEWKTYSTDRPSNIGELLIKQGFEKAETESFMALDLTQAKYSLDNNIVFAEVTDEQGIRDAIAVQEQVWGGDFSWQYRHLLATKQSDPDSVTIYVVYVDGVPVTSAWITFNGNSPFAGIWGGSTLKAFRGRGYYTSLLNQRIKEAKERDKKYLIIDASDMSRPIVEKHGFQLIATTTGYDSPATKS